MAEAKKLSVTEALEQAELIEGTLDRFEQTAPDAVRVLGGRDVLAACSEMTCIGPMPRLDVATWASMSREFQERREWEARGNTGGTR